MNRKKWIKTGTRPLHPALAKKLYDQNITKYFNLIGSGLCFITSVLNTKFTPSYDSIKTSTTTTDKYTIVELTHNNKHYHGLSSRAYSDKENVVTGIAVAYHRAFEKMMGGTKIQCNILRTKADDNAVDLHIKQWDETQGNKNFGCLTHHQYLKRLSEEQNTPIYDIINKKSKLVDKAISDLLACTYVDLKQYDLKTVLGAKAALKEISKYGYTIYELHNTDPLNLTYVLQRFGKELTHRNINIKLTHGDKQ